MLLSGNKTLLDIPLILTDGNYRKQVVASIQDKELLNFWNNVFPKFGLHALVPVLNKLSVFTDSEIIKPIICQPKSDIKFQEIINNQKIFIANLAKGTLGEKNAHVLGSFILSGFQMAILARASIPKPQRKFYSLIIDEFHNYADSSNVSSINSLLSEARKYNLSLITATQFLGQVDRRIKDAIFGNIGTLVCLRVGIDDAQVLQKELGQFTAEDLLNLNVGQAIVRMGTAKDSFNLTIPLLQKPDTDYTQEILKLAQQRKTVATPGTTHLTTPTPAPKIAPNITTSHTQNNLSSEEKDFLTFIYQSTEILPLGELIQKTGLNSRKVYSLINNLSQKGLLSEARLKLSVRGRKARTAIITPQGIVALGHPLPTGKGGALHQYFQRIIKTYAEKQGYQATIEQPLDEQKSVDLSLVKGIEKTAVEISITTDANQEFNNIQKNLSAGYDRLIVLCADNQTLENLKKRKNQSFSPEIQGKIFLSPITNFYQLI